VSLRVVSGSEARSNNPFSGPASDLLIVSIDTLAGERMFARLQESSVAPYDLVVFDEAHKLSANREPDFTMRKTDRYRLAEALAGLDSGPTDGSAVAVSPRLFCRDLLWARFSLLLPLAIRPEVLSTFDGLARIPSMHGSGTSAAPRKMVRFDGSAIYPTRVSDTLSYDLNPETGEQGLYPKPPVTFARTTTVRGFRTTLPHGLP
jgi:hypothetical protein